MRTGSSNRIHDVFRASYSPPFVCRLGHEKPSYRRPECGMEDEGVTTRCLRMFFSVLAVLVGS